MYISEVKDDLINFDFTVPQFFDKEKFKINVELIPNKLTKELIEENSKLEYIFKVILGSFNKKKGQYNNLMWYFVGCEWMAEGNYILKMKYHFRQDEYDDDEGVN